MRRKALILAAALAACVATAASAQVVTLATNPQGSLAYLTGTAIAKVLQTNTDLTARVQPMGGSSSYTPMIARGEVTFGFSNSVEFLEAYDGRGPFEGNPLKDLRLVGMVFPLRTGVAVAADLGIEELQELEKVKGKNITSGYTSLKTIELYLASALECAGVSYDDFNNVPVSDFVKGILALGEGKADITWISLGSAAGRQVEAQLQDRGGWRYLDFGGEDTEAAACFEEKVPGAEIVQETNESLPGIGEPTHIVQLPYLMATSKDTDPELVEKVVKSLVENKDELEEAFAPFKRLELQEIARIEGIPYHPGAIAAYEELGIPVAEGEESAKQ